MSTRPTKAKAPDKTTPAAPVASLFRRKRATPVAKTALVARGIGALDLSQIPVDEITLTMLDPRSLVAPNFQAYELTQSDLAARRSIQNGFASDQQLRAAVHLARQVLQPIRAAFGSFTPNSVYRSQALERALKNKPATWISTSQHARGEACDFEIVGMATLELAAWARDKLEDFDQIICECYDPNRGPNSGWVHVSLCLPGQGNNRRQCLSYVPDPASGRLVYVDGLQAMA
jgi:uncharacterized protein YcbK (DUF882 family)